MNTEAMEMFRRIHWTSNTCSILSRSHDRFSVTDIVALLTSGSDIILYTTDGGDEGYMSRGTLPGEVFTVGDFGCWPSLLTHTRPGNPLPSFNAQKKFNPPGKSPNMCSEYYTGWLTHWGETMANTSSMNVCRSRQVLTIPGRRLLGRHYPPQRELQPLHGPWGFQLWVLVWRQW
jgi:hypothetical protein